MVCKVKLGYIAPLHGYHSSFQTDKNPDFCRRITGNMSKNTHLLIQIISEHHARKMNFSMNKVQVSYFIEPPQSNCPDYTNSLTFP